MADWRELQRPSRVLTNEQEKALLTYERDEARRHVLRLEMEVAMLRDQHNEDLQELTAAARDVNTLRALLRVWESRVICPQCGHRYTESACGFAHIQVQAALEAK